MVSKRGRASISEIARSLGEPVRLIKTENRLSRNLARATLRTVLQDALVQQGAKRSDEDTLLDLGSF